MANGFFKMIQPIFKPAWMAVMCDIEGGCTRYNPYDGASIEDARRRLEERATEWKKLTSQLTGMAIRCGEGGCIKYNPYDPKSVEYASRAIHNASQLRAKPNLLNP